MTVGCLEFPSSTTGEKVVAAEDPVHAARARIAPSPRATADRDRGERLMGVGRMTEPVRFPVAEPSAATLGGSEQPGAVLPCPSS